VGERYSEYLSTKYFVVSSSKLEETSNKGFDGWIVDRKKKGCQKASASSSKMFRTAVSSLI